MRVGLAACMVHSIRKAVFCLVGVYVHVCSSGAKACLDYAINDDVAVASVVIPSWRVAVQLFHLGHPWDVFSKSLRSLLQGRTILLFLHRSPLRAPSWRFVPLHIFPGLDMHILMVGWCTANDASSWCWHSWRRQWWRAELGCGVPFWSWQSGAPMGVPMLVSCCNKEDEAVCGGARAETMTPWRWFQWTLLSRDCAGLDRCEACNFPQQSSSAKSKLPCCRSLWPIVWQWPRRFSCIVRRDLDVLTMVQSELACLRRSDFLDWEEDI